MPYDGSGNFSSLGPPDFPAITGATISSTYYNNELNDIFSGLSTALCRDGQSTVSGHFNWNAKNLTNVGSFSAATGSLTGTLAVTGAVTLSSTLAVTGVTTLSAATSMNGLVTVTSGAAEQIRLRNAAPLLTGFNAAGTVRQGYVEFGAASTVLGSDAGSVAVVAGGATRLTIASTGGATFAQAAVFSAGASFAGAPTPASGSSLEIGFSGGASFLQSYNRTGVAYLALSLLGSQIDISPNGVTRLSVTTTGASITGTLASSGALTVTAGGLTVSAGGANITGAVVTSTTVTAGGALTVSAGGAAITGNSTVTGTLNVTSTLSQAGSAVWTAANLVKGVAAGTDLPTRADADARYALLSGATFTGGVSGTTISLSGLATLTGGANFGDANNTMTLTSSKPRWTLDSTDYIEFDRTANKINFVIGGVTIASLTASDFKTAGNITASTTP